MTKLEEIALAIHRARYPDAPVMDASILDLGPTVGPLLMLEARAAVEAMKVPNWAMLDAPYRAAPPELRPGAQHFWESMITAILNEKPGA